MPPLQNAFFLAGFAYPCYSSAYLLTVAPDSVYMLTYYLMGYAHDLPDLFLSFLAKEIEHNRLALFGSESTLNNFHQLGHNLLLFMLPHPAQFSLLISLIPKRSSGIELRKLVKVNRNFPKIRIKVGHTLRPPKAYGLPRKRVLACKEFAQDFEKHIPIALIRLKYSDDLPIIMYLAERSRNSRTKGAVAALTQKMPKSYRFN
jgi:hypothetical protein